MGVCLRLGGERVVGAANYITLVNPTLHPDRVMPEHDFLYMLEGSWEIAEEGMVYPLQSDDVLILPAGRHHYGSGLCSANNRHMYIHVKPLEGERQDGNVSPGNGLHPESPEISDGFIFLQSLVHCQGNPHIRQLFQEIIAQHWGEGSLKAEKLSLLVRLLLCELKEQQEKPVSSPSRNLAEEISRLIRTTPQTFFTGKELAERFFVCERTLSNLFKKTYGKTLYAYQMDAKLEMVRQFLISQPDVKLHETALNFGFCDEFHLSRTFRKKYGISPGKYRENHCRI